MIESFANDVNDKSIIPGGLQRIQTIGYVFPHPRRITVPWHEEPYTDSQFDSLHM
jgi:hypothetical protein